MSIHVFGIRHHGPGCARSLLTALERLDPDIVLVEGPPDAHDALPLLMHEEMQTPVALLIYAVDEPRRSVFYPFTHYSPEWQAVRYALERGRPVHFVDLPQAIQLSEGFQPARDAQPEDGVEGRSPGDGANGAEREPAPDSASAQETQVRDDPLGLLAEAAGYTDHELWWEHQIEQRQDAEGLFEGILEAMAALRDGQDGAGLPGSDEEERRREALREAAMRQAIRAAQRERYERIAVVCGAWHAPVLAVPGPAAPDAALLSGLPCTKVRATWIPWTNSRLSYRSGYGAGVRSPGWYEHVWTSRDRVAIRWLSKVVQLLRGEDLDAPSSNVIEAVRLAEALAAVRALPMPGLAELHEAAQTVLCGGAAAPMDLIRDRLEIGERLGTVPRETPVVPLQQDLEAAQRRLRLKPTSEEKMLDLDLRNETDRARSHLLHRLRLLDIAWGHPHAVSGKSGTFHELWRLCWQPEFAVDLIEASVWGNTVADAAAARARHRADTAHELAELTQLLDAVILSALPAVTAHILARVQEQAALSSDVRRLMAALPALARVVRYGDVRGTAAAEVRPVVDALFERVVVGLVPACSALDDDAAQEIVAGMEQVQESLSLLELSDERAEWHGVLQQLGGRDGVHGLVRGRSCRLLLDDGILGAEDLQQQAGLALAPVVEPAQAAAWLEGVLRGSGQLLMHQDGLWQALDAWLSDLVPETFTAVLPLVRRAFSGFQPPEKRAMGEKAKRMHQKAADKRQDAASDEAIERARADLVLPVLAQVLGVRLDGDR